MFHFLVSTSISIMAVLAENFGGSTPVFICILTKQIELIHRVPRTEMLCCVSTASRGEGGSCCVNNYISILLATHLTG